MTSRWHINNKTKKFLKNSTKQLHIASFHDIVGSKRFININFDR